MEISQITNLITNPLGDEDHKALLLSLIDRYRESRLNDPKILKGKKRVKEDKLLLALTALSSDERESLMEELGDGI